MSHTSRAFLIAAVVVASTACVPTATSSPTPIPAPATSPSAKTTATAARLLPNEAHWARNSAEHRAVFIEVYRNAGEKLATLVTGHAPGTWGVILDADETTLDNSDYQKSRVPFGGGFDATAWNAWVDEARAPALPGSVAFLALVHRLGGRVVIVSNRDAAQCPITRVNLGQVGLVADLVLCRTTTGDKNPRFQSVQNGTAAAAFPALTVLEWVGDNIQDFPTLNQTVRSSGDAAFSKFGDTYFALPNAMYGSWETNPRQ